MNKKNYYKSIIVKTASTTNTDNINIVAHKNRLSKIIDSANATRLVTISYIDSKGKRTKRMVEPYKLTESDFWGYDIDKDGIRRFKTKNIRGVKKSIKTFEPRWDIEINN